MSTKLETRLRRLEAEQTPPRVVVVAGHSDAEHSAKIAALKASSEASDRDLFIICIMQFGERA